MKFTSSETVLFLQRKFTVIIQYKAADIKAILRDECATDFRQHCVGVRDFNRLYQRFYCVYKIKLWPVKWSSQIAL